MLTLVLLLAQFTVSGQILLPASSHYPLPSLVRLDGVSNVRVKETITENGRFEFKDVPEGIYEIEAKIPYYGWWRQSIEVSQSLARDGRIVIVIDVAHGVESGRVVPNPDEDRSLRYEILAPEALRLYRGSLDAAKNGDEEGMRRQLEAALRIEPEFPDALNDLGTYFHRHRDYQKSIELFTRASSLDKNFFHARVNLGGSLIEARRYEEAVEENRKAVALRPKNPLANSQLGIALFYWRRYDEALPSLETARRLDPAAGTYPQLFLAEIYARKGQFGQAIEALEEFLRYHPDHPSAARFREQLEEIRNRFKKF